MKGISSPLSTPADLTGSPKLYSPLILQSGNSFPTHTQTTTRRRAGGHADGTTWGHINNGYGIHCAISSLLLCLEGKLHRSFF